MLVTIAPALELAVIQLGEIDAVSELAVGTSSWLGVLLGESSLNVDSGDDAAAVVVIAVGVSDCEQSGCVLVGVRGVYTAEGDSRAVGTAVGETALALAGVMVGELGARGSPEGATAASGVELLRLGGT